MKTIVLSGEATRDFDKLPSEGRRAVFEAPTIYAVEGRGDVKPLAGRRTFRLRVGPYRVVFDEDATTILAIYIGRRETTTYRRH